MADIFVSTVESAEAPAPAPVDRGATVDADLGLEEETTPLDFAFGIV